MHTLLKTLLTIVASVASFQTLHAQVSDPGLESVAGRTNQIMTDSQNEFPCPKGVTSGLSGESVMENGPVKNIEILFRSGEVVVVPVFISPHQNYPAEHGWYFESAPEAPVHNIGIFDRQDALSF